MSTLASAGKTLVNNPRELPYASKWLYSLLLGSGPMKDRRPWMNYRVIEWLDAQLEADMTVFEYGSGGSTLFLAERVANVVSVEHDKDFFQLMEKHLQLAGISNCTYQLCAPVPLQCEEKPAYACTSFTSDWPAHSGMSFEAYVKTIDDYPEKSFDLVMVDGRARPSCALRALPKIKDGGWLLVDNMERPRYGRIRELLAAYESEDFFGVVPYEVRPQRTVVWRMVAK